MVVYVVVVDFVYLGVGLTHPLVEGLMIVYAGLENGDVAGDRLHLAAPRPTRHRLNVLNKTK